MATLVPATVPQLAGLPLAAGKPQPRHHLGLSNRKPPTPQHGAAVRISSTDTARALATWPMGQAVARAGSYEVGGSRHNSPAGVVAQGTAVQVARSRNNSPANFPSASFPSQGTAVQVATFPPVSRSPSVSNRGSSAWPVPQRPQIQPRTEVGRLASRSPPRNVVATQQGVGITRPTRLSLRAQSATHWPERGGIEGAAASRMEPIASAPGFAGINTPRQSQAQSQGIQVPQFPQTLQTQNSPHPRRQVVQRLSVAGAFQSPAGTSGPSRQVSAGVPQIPPSPVVLTYGEALPSHRLSIIQATSRNVSPFEQPKLESEVPIRRDNHLLEEMLGEMREVSRLVNMRRNGNQQEPELSISGLQDTLAEQQKQFIELEERMKSTLSELQVTEEKRNDAIQELFAERRSKETMEQDHHKLTLNEARSAERLAQVFGEHEESIKRLQTEIRVHQSNSSTLQASMENAEERARECAETLKEETNVVRQLESEKNVLRSEFERAREGLARVHANEAKISDSDRELRELRVRVAHLEENLRVTQEESDNWRRQFEDSCAQALPNPEATRNLWDLEMHLRQEQNVNGICEPGNYFRLMLQMMESQRLPAECNRLTRHVAELQAANIDLQEELLALQVLTPRG